MTTKDRHNSAGKKPGTIPLADLCGTPMGLVPFLGFAVGIARALAEVHKDNIVLKSIRPANIMVDSVSGTVRLTNPSSNSPRLPGTRDAETGGRLDTALAYMSPEQLGRLKRVVDTRSDLYSLGITFYEMLVGAPPFTADDLLGWVHCHFARMPKAPIQLVPAIPPVVSEIVMKLLAKAVEERYQTAAGLLLDLEKCWSLLEAEGDIESFPLATGDISERLLIPDKLYGRQAEIDLLHQAFSRVAGRGLPETILLAGYSGIGKTSLVRELYGPVIKQHGFFITGKFDQYKRNIPYSTIIEAFQRLIRQILTEQEDRLTGWRERLQRALGINSRLLIDIIPQIELIIGKQPPAPQLPVTEAESRFTMVFRQFVDVFCQREHPMVIFLDDLQWADAASLTLIERLTTDRDIRYLLMIGAYRDNEVDPSHPLMSAVRRIDGSEAILQTIGLSPLSFGELGHLLADTLRTDRMEVEPLTRLIYKKTGGNPFFAIQFLMTLSSGHLIEFDPALQRWKWDIGKIQSKDYTDNVVDLLAAKFRRLPQRTREALKLAACIGNIFDLESLAIIGKTTEKSLEKDLREAVRESLLFALRGKRYMFFHDRIQQAAYANIPDEQRNKLHLQIGRLLLDRLPQQAIDEKVFDIVNHFNMAADLIDDRKEKERVAELNLLAGRKAKAGTAFASAISYFISGMAQLSDDSWQTQKELTFSLYKAGAECEYLNGNFIEAERLLSQIFGNTDNKIGIAAATGIKILLSMTRGRNDLAVEAAGTCLRLFGIEIPAHPTWEQVREAYDNVWINIGSSSIEDLIDLPDMTDPEIRAAMEVLSVTITPSVYTDKNLLILVLCHMVNLSLMFGITEASASGFVWFGVVLGGPAFREFSRAFSFGKLACDLVEKRNMAGQKGRVLVTFASLVNPWSRHIQSSIDILRVGFEAARQAGDITFACYGCQHLIVQLITKGDPLDEVFNESESRLEFVRKAKFKLSEYVIISQQRLIQNLRGRTQSFSSFSDADFNEVDFERYLAENRKNLASAEFRYYIRKLQARFLSEDYPEAQKAMLKAKDLLWTSPSFLEVPEYYYYGGLLLAALYDDTSSPKEKEKYQRNLSVHQRQFEDWPQYCPENFLNKQALLSAELARISDKVQEAEHLYEQAVQSARKHGFVQNEGLANELASRFYRRRGFETIAHAYLKEARSCYSRWGADGKVRHLERQYPRLVQDEEAAATKALGIQVGHLDAVAVIKASQAISGEIVLARLLETLMRIIVENVGAQKGCLVLVHDDGLKIEVVAMVEGQDIKVVQPIPGDPATLLPLSMLNYIRRTGETVIVDDATGPNMFSSDPYIQGMQPVSALCLPLVRQSKIVGIVYLENNLVKAAFTKERIAVLELLSAQAAISLENAVLYFERSRAEQALRESEEKYRAIFENSGTPLIFIEEDKTISICNRAFERLSGYRQSEVEGRMTWADTVARVDDLARMTEYHRLRRIDPKKAPENYEFQLLDREGGIKDIVVTVSTMPGCRQSLAALVDVTERKRAEKELARLVTAIEQAGEAFFITDTDFAISYVNPAFERMTGYAKNEIIGRQTAILDCTEAGSPVFGTVKQTLVRGEVWSGRLSYKRKDGSIYEAEATASPVRDIAGAIINYVTIHRDISREVKLEKELRQVHKMEAIGTLAGGIAHDFNNILTAIQGHTELVHLKIPLESQFRHSLDQVLVSCRRAKDLVQQILAFSRQTEREMKPVKIVPLIDEVLKLLRSSLPTTIEIRRHLEIGPDHCRILADATQIHQVVMNLATNAAHAIGAGGGVLGVGLTRVVMDDSLVFRYPDLKPGPFLKLTVEDTGRGIDQAIIERIFDPYFTTKPPGEGTGMGLSVAQGIIKTHGGTITVYSEPEQGTTFSVYLPEFEGKDAIETPNALSLVTGDERILFVDDEKILVELGKEMLETLGYRVTAAIGSPEALEIFRNRPDDFDLVITDMTMPEMTGIQLAKKITAIRSDIPFILCTGFSELINGGKSSVDGICEVIMKPYVLTDMAAAIRKVLTRLHPDS